MKKLFILLAVLFLSACDVHFIVPLAGKCYQHKISGERGLIADTTDNKAITVTRAYNCTGTGTDRKCVEDTEFPTNRLYYISSLYIISCDGVTNPDPNK